MIIWLHIGLEQAGAGRLQQVLAGKRARLARQGVLYPRSPGNRNHTRLYMAVTDPDHVDPLRYNRGFQLADKQAELRRTLADDLSAEVARARPRAMILSASQLATSLHRPSELRRLRDLLSPLSQDIRVVAHIDEPARVLARHYGQQIFEGRNTPLSRDVQLAKADGWWQGALATMAPANPKAGQFEESQGAPFWLDYEALQTFWENSFGTGSFRFRCGNLDRPAGDELSDEITAAFGLNDALGRVDPVSAPAQHAAAWLTRGRLMNGLLLQLLASGQFNVHRQLWHAFMTEIQVDGPPIDPGSLGAVSDRFAPMLKRLCDTHPGLDPKRLQPPARLPDWAEADPEYGFRASQYLLAFMYRIERATRQAKKASADQLAAVNSAAAPAQTVLPPLAMQKYDTLKGTAYAPHNRLGMVNEESLAAAYHPAMPREVPKGSSGNVIVGCMKNEAPYIVEWVAYHRAIGIDNFLIYTNGCEDGTDQILDRLQELGVLQHRLNDDWKGNSPQQWALDQSLNEPLIRDADWIAHIDVDEFINVRCGNGTLQDFLSRVPDATNIAMTWRLFGHNGVQSLSDRFVIDQFDHCAPKYCPKPHTVWGFKTMFRNIGAYGKISCHRPNKLAEGSEDRVRWVNGSGQDMTAEAARNGWRNSRKSIGYDLLQLNHYALRSAESFLIKRQRGRALHVDRSIGLNYWIRMDWSDHRDVTIKRNVPRLQSEYDRLLRDNTLRKWHEHGRAWHRAKANELLAQPEFRALFDQALQLRLNGTERAAYALALDMES